MRANFIPAVILAVFCFTAFRAMYLRSKLIGVRIALAIAALALVAPAAIFVSNYALMVPFEEWFIEWHSLPGAEITAGLAGALLGVMFASAKLRPGRLNGPVLIACSVITAALVVTPFIKQLYASVDYNSLKDKWSGDVCLQSSGYTCVPACIVTIIHKMGGQITEPELARAAGSTTNGTETWYLQRALRKRGYELVGYHLKSIEDAIVPSQLGVTMGDIQHAVVLLHKDGDEIIIGEPLRGRKKYDWALFKRVYHPANWCFTVKKMKR